MDSIEKEHGLGYEPQVVDNAVWGIYNITTYKYLVLKLLRAVCLLDQREFYKLSKISFDQDAQETVSTRPRLQ